MTARNRSFTITAPGPVQVTRDHIVSAIRSCADAFLTAPIANLGHRGIAKAAREVRGWLRRTDRPHEDLPQAARLMEQGGTGGALFRNIYRDFLAECTQWLDDPALRTGHTRYGEAAELWTQTAALIAKAGETGDPALFEMATNLNPTGHMGTPEEIAAPVVFLASPAASRVSGTNLVVDGALTRGVQL